MDNRPIGFFDSGIGGLTSVVHIMRNLPGEQIIFYGDTARTPYGSKSPDTIRQFTLQIGDFLVGKGVKMIVIACNTVSSICLEDLRRRYPQIPVVGVIAPTCREIVKRCNTESRIGILATRVTVKTDAYAKKIRQYEEETLQRNGSLELFQEHPGTEHRRMALFSKACPALVPLIEEGIIDHEIMDLTLRYYLDDFLVENQIDTLILGCTHYPLIAENLRRLYPEVRIISSSHEVATAVRMELESRQLLADPGRDRAGEENVFYASDLSQNFVTMIERILGKEKEALNIRFKNLDI